PPGEFGTPKPRDEPLAENPPYGAMIDYYLKSAASAPVVIEILDPAGATIRRYSSEDKPQAINPDTLEFPAFWRPTPAQLATTKGMHRWVWDLRPTTPAEGRGAGGGAFGRRASAVLPGTYTVRLTVGDKSTTQALRVLPDPRTR